MSDIDEKIAKLQRQNEGLTKFVDQAMTDHAERLRAEGVERRRREDAMHRLHRLGLQPILPLSRFGNDIDAAVAITRESPEAMAEVQGMHQKIKEALEVERLVSGD